MSIKQGMFFMEEDEYIVISSEEDINIFKQKYGSFGDSCITQCNITTGYSVNESLSMEVPFTQSCTISIIIQRQNKLFRTIELNFSKVIHFNFVPAQENYDRIIESAYFNMYKGIFYWADDGDFNPETKDQNTCWVSSKILRWKFIK